MESNKKHFHYLIYGLIILIIILFIWELAVRLEYISSLALPLPTNIFSEGFSLVISSDFLKNWLRTLTVWSISLAIGLGVGLMLGFAAGTSRKFQLTFLPLLGYLRSIPPIAMFPIALIAMGAGGLPIGLVASIGAALYVFPGTAESTRQSSNRYTDLAKILGSNRLQFFKMFVVPGAAVHVLASSRIAATYAFAVCVAGEMIIGGRFGVGAAILDLSERYNLEQAYVYVLFTGIIGLIIDTAFQRVNRIRMLGDF